jgi:hypothetical protein
MSQAGRDECQTFPVATLNDNDRRSKASKRQFSSPGPAPPSHATARDRPRRRRLSPSIEPSYSKRQKAIVERWEAEGRWTRCVGREIKGTGRKIEIATALGVG